MISFFSSLSAWDWLDLVGLLMVFAGVVGEIWSARKHNHFWEKIWGYVLILGLGLEVIALPHHFKEAAELKKEAEDAKAVAAAANERAGLANEQAAKLSKETEQLRGKNLTNELRVAELTTKNLVLEKQVLELQIKTADRRVFPGQRKIILDSLKAVSGEYVEISFDGSVPEISTFASELIDLLRECGYGIRPDSASSLRAYGVPQVGMTIRVNGYGVSNGYEYLPASATSMEVAFNRAHIPVIWVNMPWALPATPPDNKRFVIFIGTKP